MIKKDNIGAVQKNTNINDRLDDLWEDYELGKITKDEWEEKLARMGIGAIMPEAEND